MLPLEPPDRGLHLGDRHCQVLAAPAPGGVVKSSGADPGALVRVGGDLEPEARGLGVARLLMEAIAARTVARGGARLEWRVLDWNERALGFYRHIGATDLREWQTCRLDGRALHALAERGATHAPPDDDAGAPADWEDPVAT